MGIYDRDYYRDDHKSGLAIGDWSMVTTLIAINVAVFLAEMVLGKGFVDLLTLQSDHLGRAWTYLTYGFVHDPRNFQHILFNMIALWLFGRDVERVYGRRAFLQVYLSLVVLSGAGFLLLSYMMGPERTTELLGASGAIMGISVIYVFHFPKTTFLLFLVIPVPAWALVGLYIFGDISGTFQATATDNVAHTAHLAGAAFGYLYYRTGWTLASLWPGGWSLSALKPRTKLRVHHDERDEEPDEGDDELRRRVDLILEKISRQGEASLSRDERRTLEDASRRFRGTRRG